MKTWTFLAALALLPGTSSAQVTIPEVTIVGRVPSKVVAPVKATPADEGARADLLKKLEAERTALLPQLEPLPQITVRYQPRLNDIKAEAVKAKNPAELAKAKKDLNDWEYVVLHALHTADQKVAPGETYPAFEARKVHEIEFVQSLRQQLAGQRVQSQAAAVRAASLQPGLMFDNAVPGTGSSLPPLSLLSDGAVKADILTGPAKYNKLRNIAVTCWGANPKIVDAAIAEAVRQNVDPALVLAVIWQESRFNTHATSPVGARGLMQVMPDTGRGLGVSNPDNLYDMKTNLRAGVQYLRNAAAYLHLNVNLSDISEAAPNKIKALLASYNAGCGAVSKWLRQQGENLVRIPYAETRAYVRIIGGKLASLGEALGW